MGFQMIGGDTKDMDAVVNQLNQNIAQLKVNEQTTIIKDDSGTRRVLLGKGLNGFYGLKISQEGTDVYSAEDAELHFNSDSNVLKIVGSGTVTLPFAADGTTQTVTVTHNLGYVPIVYAFTTSEAGITGSFPQILVQDSGVDAGKVLQVISWDADDTEVNFYNQSQLQGTAGGQVKYYLLQETAAD